MAQQEVEEQWLLWKNIFKIYYFNSTTVTPISPSPKVPKRKDFTWGWFFKKVWIPVFNFPVPFPCIILTVFNLAKIESSKNLSTTKIASSTLRPITFISVLAVFDLEREDKKHY